MERVALPDAFPQNSWKVAGNRASVHRRPSGAREATGPGVQSPLHQTVLGWQPLRVLKEPLCQCLPLTPCPPPATCMHYKHCGTVGQNPWAKFQSVSPSRLLALPHCPGFPPSSKELSMQWAFYHPLCMRFITESGFCGDGGRCVPGSAGSQQATGPGEQMQSSSTRSQTCHFSSSLK